MDLVAHRASLRERTPAATDTVAAVLRVQRNQRGGQRRGRTHHRGATVGVLQRHQVTTRSVDHLDACRCQLLQPSLLPRRLQTGCAFNREWTLDVKSRLRSTNRLRR